MIHISECHGVFGPILAYHDIKVLFYTFPSLVVQPWVLLSYRTLALFNSLCSVLYWTFQIWVSSVTGRVQHSLSLSLVPCENCVWLLLQLELEWHCQYIVATLSLDSVCITIILIASVWIVWSRQLRKSSGRWWIFAKLYIHTSC